MDSHEYGGLCGKGRSGRQKVTGQVSLLKKKHERDVELTAGTLRMLRFHGNAYSPAVNWQLRTKYYAGFIRLLTIAFGGSNGCRFSVIGIVINH